MFGSRKLWVAAIESVAKALKQSKGRQNSASGQSDVVEERSNVRLYDFLF